MFGAPINTKELLSHSGVAQSNAAWLAGRQGISTTAVQRSSRTNPGILSILKTALLVKKLHSRGLAISPNSNHQQTTLANTGAQLQDLTWASPLLQRRPRGWGCAGPTAASRPTCRLDRNTSAHNPSGCDACGLQWAHTSLLPPRRTIAAQD